MVAGNRVVVRVVGQLGGAVVGPAHDAGGAVGKEEGLPLESSLEN
jgi:hypothetical protein